ncbi:MAG TPA: Gfo/Idh/MocA family oxidoreductase [Terriglobales bacterium]|nr:Gfo/Idh/MocA family oxidoreductase [Terriglobales bacterium]
MATERTNVAVVGAGAFGRNHARVYRQLEQAGEPVHLAAVADLNPAQATALARESGPGVAAFTDLAELIAGGHVRAASVAVPTLEHLDVARRLMAAGIDVLIEKPLAATLADADKLIALAKQHGRIAQVGHLERFNPAVQATLPLVTRPMFFEVHRLSVFSPRSLDIDVVLDLMIHDLDIVLALVNSPAKEVRAVGLPILSPRVDIANVRLEFESGCVANFTASRVSTEKVRKLRFFQPQQYISVDYTRQDVLVFTVASTGRPSVGVAVPGAPGSPIQIAKPAVQTQEPLQAELRAFLEAVRRRSRPLVPLEDGRRALAAALDIQGAMREHSQKVSLDVLGAGN